MTIINQRRVLKVGDRNGQAGYVTHQHQHTHTQTHTHTSINNHTQRQMKKRRKNETAFTNWQLTKQTIFLRFTVNTNYINAQYQLNILYSIHIIYNHISG